MTKQVLDMIYPTTVRAAMVWSMTRSSVIPLFFTVSHMQSARVCSFFSDASPIMATRVLSQVTSQGMQDDCTGPSPDRKVQSFMTNTFNPTKT